MRKYLFYLLCFLLIIGCDSQNTTGPGDDTTNENQDDLLILYPDFITNNEDYFITRISNVPEISAEKYMLTVSGIGDAELSFSLDDLMKIEQIEFPLTVECIGNPANGSLLGTAYWRGFGIYDFLTGIGMDESAGGVKYTAADGYFASHTLDQIKNNTVIGALFMNDETLPPVQGFPIRIITPGYYGVKQPAWVTSIQILSKDEIDAPRNDYWAPGWIVDTPIETDCKIFFPVNNTQFQNGDSIAAGGAAFGSNRITDVEISIDSGESWIQTDIIKSMDADNVWVFWYTNLSFPASGTYTILARATDDLGNIQKHDDNNIYDGNTLLPSTNVIVK